MFRLLRHADCRAHGDLREPAGLDPGQRGGVEVVGLAQASEPQCRDPGCSAAVDAEPSEDALKGSGAGQ